MNCEQANNQGLVEKYVAGQLPDQEMTAFEEHYFGCDDCLQAVQLGQAIHSTAVNSPKVVRMPERRHHRPQWRYPLAAAAAAILVAVIGWRALVRQPATPQIAQTPQSPTSAAIRPVEPPVAEPRLVASTLDLGAVAPLAYRPSVLRGGNEDSAERFKKAMESYLTHDYRQAAASLTSIPVAVPGSGKSEEHVSDAGIQIYLGISQLMLNQNTSAIRSLSRAAAYGDTPYLESADFYWAKALIRKKQYAEAADRLKRTVQLKGDRQSEAQQLLEQLNKLAVR